MVNRILVMLEKAPVPGNNDVFAFGIPGQAPIALPQHRPPSPEGKQLIIRIIKRSLESELSEAFVRSSDQVPAGIGERAVQIENRGLHEANATCPIV